jgi:hypothetical protein
MVVRLLAAVALGLAVAFGSLVARGESNVPLTTQFIHLPVIKGEVEGPPGDILITPQPEPLETPTFPGDGHRNHPANLDRHRNQYPDPHPNQYSPPHGHQPRARRPACPRHRDDCSDGRADSHPHPQRRKRRLPEPCLHPNMCLGQRRDPAPV